MVAFKLKNIRIYYLLFLETSTMFKHSHII
jgi:hypothetical protein